MFKKILVAEDIDSINKGLSAVLKKLEIPEMYHAVYCDEAYLKAKRAVLDGNPFDLLICDLSFKPDHRAEKLTSGEELVAVVAGEFPEIPIIVYSVEDHPQIVRSLWNRGQIRGYVCKGRNGLTNLENAIRTVNDGDSYLSPEVENSVKKKNFLTLREYELALLTCLANGFTQEQIETHFRKEGIKPSSRSSMEKRLKELKEDFNANTTIHLITILKDLRLL
ncbi:response regulator transcription factor [Sinomicrobium weinanense]|uniref:Response regulator transcription factor n=1 Tax=Sinomicrobium weinanense TaxID=2842200 RepID=A0A926Q3D6_9FLAO|nr:response regulator transcription factor [Sinomicrobium weinanense]MBC9795896.1 response regulator transcription factor [Sinomicrobium weinanense]MBU3124725.1 DNA-binding response regulator [Sinomicrobium weinanense]